jgi:CheY-like chemotaxis protein
MTNVLVVDDSLVDRRLVAELLRENPELQIAFVGNGREALQWLDGNPVDLILTDLVMPEVNGLELVAAVCRDYPLVPVILMTSKGNEETAVQALQAGAASYVSKKVLKQKLLGTLNRVLARSLQQRSHSRLMGCMATSHFTFHLENDSALFNPLITYLQEAVSQMGLYGDDEQMRMGVALDEALANALYHGNLEIGSELRDDPDAMCALIEDRRRQSPYCDRRLHVEVSLSHEEIKFIVGDEGPGFDPNSLPDPTDPANLEKVSGRGILLMRTFMDEVTFNPTGNVVKMVKHIKKHHALTS